MLQNRNGPERFGLTEEEYGLLWDLMLEAFPPTERRDRAGMDRVLRDPSFSLLVKRDEAGAPAAFLTYWSLDGFRYVEHFAVSASLRGQGMGGRMLRELMETGGLPMVLEVEPPENETARRRVGFYERLGFHFNGYAYEQPPLQAGQPAVPLYIMSWPEALIQPAFEKARDELYRRVYHKYPPQAPAGE